MTVYLNNFQKATHAANLMNSHTFLSKNKVSINNPKQTHFSVEGVQQYTVDEIKAMKIREERLFDRKQGEFIQLKTVLLSDQVIENEPEPVSKKNKKEKEEKPSLEAVKKRPKSRINPRNAVSTNNQAVVKLEKQFKVRDGLQKKLDKLQKQYKDHFKGIDMKQGLDAGKKQTQKELSESVMSHESRREDEYEPEIETEKQEVTTYHNSFGRKPRQSRNSERRSELQISEVTNSQASIGDNGLNVGFKLLTNYSSFSQKLGTAVHELFK